MKSKIWSVLAGLVVSCLVCGALSGCSQPDNPAPAKPTEAVAPPTPEQTKPHVMQKGAEYGANEKYQKAMEKRFGKGSQ
jgi:hypothetical protein